MKNKFENIDEAFKQAFDGFEAKVDPSVWNNIQNAIGSSPASSTSASVFSKSIALKIVAGVIALGAVATSIYLTKENTGNKNELVAETAPIIVSSENNTILLDEENNADVAKKATENKPKKLAANSTEKLEVNQPENKVKKVAIETLPTNNSVTEQTVMSENSFGKDVAQADNSKSEKETAVKSNAKKPIVNVKPTKKEISPEELQEENNLEEVFEVEKNDSYSAKINEEMIPKSFSPNGDGIGDILKIEGENIIEFNAKILNAANGSVVFEWHTTDGFWEGRDMFGNKVDKGTYMLQVKAVGNDGKPNYVLQTITVF